MRSLIILLLVIGSIGGFGFWMLNYFANMEPRLRFIEQPVDSDLFKRIDNAR